MKSPNKMKLLTAIALAALVAAPAFAQEKKAEKHAAGQPDEAEMMAKMMELAKPGEHHKFMENNSVGSWTYTLKTWMGDPSAPPTESSGTCVTKALMGGRFFMSEIDGKFPMPGPDGKMKNMEYKGVSTDGYDNVKNKFVSSYIDNMGTMIIYMEGTFDKGARTITYTGEFEPMPGAKMKAKQVVKFVNHVEHVMEWYEDRGGKEVKTMEIIFKRAT